MGMASARLGKNELALQYYLEVEDKLLSRKNNASLAEVYRALGDLFLKEKLYALARRYYRKVLDLQPNDYAAMESAADASLSDMRFDSAEIYYKELILHYKTTANYPGLVHTYQKLANAYNQAGLPDKGLYYYLLIESIIERNGTTIERSMLYNNLGKQYVVLSKYPEAIGYLRRAEMQSTHVPFQNPEVLFANLGIALHNTGQSQEGLTYLLRARKLVADKKDLVSLANLEHLIANVYFRENDFYNALRHNTEASRLASQTEQMELLGSTYKTAAELHHQLYDLENAFEFYKKYLEVYDSLRLREAVWQQRLDQQRNRLVAAEGEIRVLMAQQNIRSLEIQRQYEQEKAEFANEKLALEAQRQRDEVTLLQKQKEVDQAELKAKALKALQVEQQLRLAAQMLQTEKQNNLIVELRQKERQAQLVQDSASRAAQFERLETERLHRLEQEETFRKGVYGTGALLAVILALLAAGFWFSRRAGRRLALQNRQIQAQNVVIIEERQKSDQLLRNILPEEIAQELKTRGYATPRFYQAATVVFTDFANFTSLSAELSPDQLIDELNLCFLAFDEITNNFGLEKIKTIGDAYMCAGGLPIETEGHAVQAVRAAIAMNDWLSHRSETTPHAVFTTMRTGIHTGPVVAGVVGKFKFAYDIWGDAVNLAARMEQLGEPGKINISGPTYEQVRHLFRCTYRGKKDVHNKGMVDMYFVEGEIS